MKFCQTCGAEINDDAVICVKCGCPVQTNKVEEEKKTDESVSVGLVILSVLIPLFGFIYWPVKAKNRPKCAKTCGVAALISFGVSFLITMMSSM